jgi:uncharacterized membrane protein
VKLKVAQFVSIMLFALVKGVFWGTWFALSRSITQITPATFLETGQQVIRNLAGPMRVLMPLTMLSALLVLWWLPRKRSAAFALTASALLLLIVATVITVGVEVPIDNQIKVWSVETLPANWQSIRERWEWFHGLRTLVSVVSLALIVGGSLWPREEQRV